MAVCKGIPFTLEKIPASDGARTRDLHIIRPAPNLLRYWGSSCNLKHISFLLLEINHKCYIFKDDRVMKLAAISKKEHEALYNTVFT